MPDGPMMLWMNASLFLFHLWAMLCRKDTKIELIHVFIPRKPHKTKERAQNIISKFQLIDASCILRDWCHIHGNAYFQLNAVNNDMKGFYLRDQAGPNKQSFFEKIEHCLLSTPRYDLAWNSA